MQAVTSYDYCVTVGHFDNRFFSYTMKHWNSTFSWISHQLWPGSFQKSGLSFSPKCINTFPCLFFFPFINLFIFQSRPGLDVDFCPCREPPMLRKKKVYWKGFLLGGGSQTKIHWSLLIFKLSVALGNEDKFFISFVLLWLLYLSNLIKILQIKCTTPVTYSSKCLSGYHWNICISY